MLEQSPLHPARTQEVNNMSRNMTFLLLTLLGMVVMSSKIVGSEMLSYDYYSQSCPGVENIVKAGLVSSSLADPTTNAAMVRLMFHDCQVQGCDASILLDSSDGEMGSSKNFGIRKREVIGVIKEMVELACPQKISCADILVLAAREAVAVSGGPKIRVPLGRRDSIKPSSLGEADASLPPSDVGVDGMLRLFGSKGMSIEESVAILGAHTLGVTHCKNLRNNLNEEFSSFSASKLACSLRLGSTLDNVTFVVNDPTTVVFDNTYFLNSMKGNGVLRIDAEMPKDPRTAPYVKSFAIDQNRFFKAFSSAFVKLSSSNVLLGSQGVVRKTC